MRTVYWFAYFVISLLGTVPSLLKLRRRKEHMDPAEYLAAVNRVASGWAARQVRNSGARIRVTGAEQVPPGPVLYVSNHQGNFDIALFMTAIPKDKGYVSKMEMRKVPVLHMWMRELGCIFIDRSSARESLSEVSRGIRLLKEGYSLVIFPEGTRNRGGATGPFSPGSIRMAVKAGVPVVPVTIDGSWRLMEGNGGRIRPGDVQVTVHPPIPTASLDRKSIAALNEEVREIIVAPLGEKNEGVFPESI